MKHLSTLNVQVRAGAISTVCLPGLSLICFFNPRIWRSIINLGNPLHDKRTEGSNPYNTIFVGRLNYATTEERLKREFEIYGPVEWVRVVKNKFTKKSRGYAFVEFRNEKDADCKYIDSEAQLL